MLNSVYKDLFQNKIPFSLSAELFFSTNFAIPRVLWRANSGHVTYILKKIGQIVWLIIVHFILHSIFHNYETFY